MEKFNNKPKNSNNNSFKSNETTLPAEIIVPDSTEITSEHSIEPIQNDSTKSKKKYCSKALTTHTKFTIKIFKQLHKILTKALIHHIRKLPKNQRPPRHTIKAVASAIDIREIIPKTLNIEYFNNKLNDKQWLEKIFWDKYDEILNKDF
ncbi:hypothetical protein KQ873_03355 [Mycoplasma zalophidermidis]|uniref:hypothetical protein n=1 Tax=Mycoplasma zalophidermidis TaxID=398174 RepID=UPI001C1241B5|nr:hypothetical protein [Mycoplasma zalophidermidis]MBU4690059.1 hypothetical protein [Mycoplasma zalophidermidis]